MQYIPDKLLNIEYKGLKLSYEKYLSWLDMEDSNWDSEFLRLEIVASSLKNKKKWSDCAEVRCGLDSVCYIAQEVVRNFDYGEYLVQHEYKQFDWFPSFVTKTEDGKNKKKYLNSNLEAKDDKTVFCGGFLASQNEVLNFLRYFIDYPSRYSYRDIDLISKKGIFVLKVTHHMSVSVIVGNKNDVEKVRHIVACSGVKNVEVFN